MCRPHLRRLPRWSMPSAHSRTELRALLARPPVERLRDGIRVVLAGPPNSGKSSLINALAEREVAIATPIAGHDARPDRGGGGPRRQAYRVDRHRWPARRDRRSGRGDRHRARARSDRGGGYRACGWATSAAACRSMLAIHARADVPGRAECRRMRLAVSAHGCGIDRGSCGGAAASARAALVPRVR